MHKIKVIVETIKKFCAEIKIGIDDIKYTEDGIEIILYRSCNSVKINAIMFPIRIPAIAR
jgi:hypothetical protein